MPFSVRSIGHYRHEKEWKSMHRKRDIIQLFWIISGDGFFMIDGINETVKPDMVVFYYPNDIHGITLTSEHLDFFWVTIDGIEASSMIQAFQFPRQPTYAGPCPIWLFKKLQNEINDISLFGLNLAAVTAYNIISLARSGISQVNDKKKIVNKCIDIINNEFSNPNLNVNYIADFLDMNRSQISCIFKREMNITLINYLIAFRHSKALQLLRTTSLPISRIAFLCGFSSTNYFIKTFKIFENITPLNFRKNGSI